MKRLLTSLLSVSALAATLFSANDAEACGGCFHPVTESTVVTGHRMAVAISKTHAVLWDQIQYAGDPAEFSWVLPVKKGAFVEVSHDAFFETLETATLSTVEQPDEGCPQNRPDGFGCGSALSAESLDAPANFGTGGQVPEDGVEVVHQGSVGPYETVTLSAEDPNALADWLEDNGYVLPDSVKPIVDAYVAENFDFIALKLAPDKGVSSMKPVRVITQGQNYTLPLRMVAAGVGESVDLVLHIIAEGRYETVGFDNGTIPANLVTWDFKEDRSDYAMLRQGLLGGNGGRAWLTSYSRKKAILSPVQDAITGQNINYFIGDGGFQSVDNIAAAYVLQGLANEEETEADAQTCLANLRSVIQSRGVTDLCDDDGVCVTPTNDQTDSRLLACGALDDFKVALEGMVPNDVVLTRLEANLPVAALDADLRLEASDDQAEVVHRFQAGLKVNPCWDQLDDSGVLVNGKPQNRLPPGAVVLLTLGAAGIALALRRKQTASANPS